MGTYEVGSIVLRCHIQKTLDLGYGVQARPLGTTGYSGDLHTARRLLGSVGFSFTRTDLDSAIQNYKDTGHAALISVPPISAANYEAAIDACESLTEPALGALAVVSANPVIRLCTFAKSTAGSGVKFYVPPDRVILHGTNVAGYLDAVPAIQTAARSDQKLNLLLKLYRASLRETDPDYRLLFQLILFEEASDGEDGKCLADKLRSFVEQRGITGDLNAVASECGLVLPEGKDMVDVIVKLRNSAAHNGKIDADSLKSYRGEWVVPVIADKDKLHKAIGEAIRYLFCALVGHTRDAKSTLVTGAFEVRFD